jgi:NAD(P)-dependent dehydrogenase (short-subunit alcohol dehydrogenase family)
VTTPLLNAAGRVLFLTGAAGGIGQATAHLYAQAGGHVAGFDLSGTPSVDAADEAGVTAAVADTLQRYGRIDHVVHAAGVAGTGPLASLPLADWRRVLDANLTSGFIVAKATAQALTQSQGALVFLASTNGRNGGSTLSGPAYAAAKAGLINLTRYLAKEWAGHVRVNAVAPGPVKTPMLDRFDDTLQTQLATAMLTGALTEADEIAAAIGYLLSDHARSITGAVLNVSGGLVLD